MKKILVCLAAMLMLAACSKPQAPDPEVPPEPQVDVAATQLRDAMQKPIDKANGAEQATLQAAERQRAAIEAAGG